MRKHYFAIGALLGFCNLLSMQIKWNNPETLSNTSLNASGVQVLNTFGRATVGWIENGAIVVRTETSAEIWSSPQVLSGTNASNLCLSSDALGNTIAAWLENGVVRSSYRSSAGNWEPSVALSSTGAANPDVGCDESGNFITVWTRGNFVESSVRLIGKNWNTPLRILSNSPQAPKVAINGDGTQEGTSLALMWTAKNSSSQHVVYVSSRLLKDSWSAPAALSDPNRRAFSGDIAVDAKGNAAALWFEYDMVVSCASQVNIKGAYANYVRNQYWTFSEDLSEDGLLDPSKLKIKVLFDAAGNAFAMWTQSYDGATYQIESCLKPARQDWKAKNVLVASNAYALSADFGLSKMGDAVSSQMFYNGKTLLLQTSATDISDGSVSWSVPVNLSSFESNAFPSVTAYVNDNALTACSAWIASNGCCTVVQACRGHVNLLAPPGALNVVQQVVPFASFTTYSNILSWTGSASPNIVSYNIYRNGVFIASVGGNVRSYTDVNRAPGEKNTYGIEAIDSLNNQSKLVTIEY